VAACSRGEGHGHEEAVQLSAGDEPANKTYLHYTDGMGHLGIHELSVKQLIVDLFLERGHCSHFHQFAQVFFSVFVFRPSILFGGRTDRRDNDLSHEYRRIRQYPHSLQLLTPHHGMGLRTAEQKLTEE
jgi:hypothetical protein